MSASLNIGDLINGNPRRRRRHFFAEPQLFHSQIKNKDGQRGFILAWRYTFYRCIASTSLKHPGKYALHCGSGHKRNGPPCPSKSKGSCYIIDGKFVAWIKKPEACDCKRDHKQVKQFGKNVATHVNSRIKAIEDSENCRVKKAVEKQTNKMAPCISGQLKERNLDKAVQYHVTKRRRERALPEPSDAIYEIEVSSDEEMPVIGLDRKERKELLLRNKRRANRRQFDAFCRKLKSTGSKRRRLAKRGEGVRTNVHIVPLDQISGDHDWVIAQTEVQREVLRHSTRFMVDNNHRCSPPWAERSLTTKGLLHGREWKWTGDILCLTKEDILHREVASKFWSKICTCAPGKRCALNKIKAVGTDFENGLWKPFLDELHKHQR